MCIGVGPWRIGACAIFLVATLDLAGCAGRATGLMVPVLVEGVPGVTVIPVLVATTRRNSTDDATLFTGDRSRQISYAEIGVSVPPDHKPGAIEWPTEVPGDPNHQFVTASVTRLDSESFKSALHREIAHRKQKRVLVFVHGYNNQFDDALYRFAQIEKDSEAPSIPVLFTWPSRGKLLAYPYDRESANYSRSALEKVLQALVDDPQVKEVAVLAHSMGNWVALEALRQMAIRHGSVPAKIANVMLAAPDVDIEVARTQAEDMGPRRPHFTLFVSQDDKALAFSSKFWGGTARLGSINPEQEPYRSALERLQVTVIDLTKLKGGDSLNHGKFAESPEVVRFIGTELASGPDITTRSAGLGGQLGGLVAGVTESAGHIATVAISAPILVVDPQSREALSDNLRSVVPGANEEPASDLTDADELGPVVAPRRAKLNPAKPSVN
jgi:esterase/lipase superfamily enzyme